MKTYYEQIIEDIEKQIEGLKDQVKVLKQFRMK